MNYAELDSVKSTYQTVSLRSELNLIICIKNKFVVNEYFSSDMTFSWDTGISITRINDISIYELTFFSLSVRDRGLQRASYKPLRITRVNFSFVDNESLEHFDESHRSFAEWKKLDASCFGNSLESLTICIGFWRVSDVRNSFSGGRTPYRSSDGEPGSVSEVKKLGRSQVLTSPSPFWNACDMIRLGFRIKYNF